MSLGTIILIILVIALLGGFSGLGGGPILRYWLLRRRRPRPCDCCFVDLAFALARFDLATIMSKPRPRWGFSKGED